MCIRDSNKNPLPTSVQGVIDEKMGMHGFFAHSNLDTCGPVALVGWTMMPFGPVTLKLSLDTILLSGVDSAIAASVTMIGFEPSGEVVLAAACCNALLRLTHHPHAKAGSNTTAGSNVAASLSPIHPRFTH